MNLRPVGSGDILGNPLTRKTPQPKLAAKSLPAAWVNIPYRRHIGGNKAILPKTHLQRI